MRTTQRWFASLTTMAFVLALSSVSAAQTAPWSPLTLRVESVTGAQAVLTDSSTGTQTTVQVGDVVQGWTVVAIASTGVEIEREDAEQGSGIRAQLPLGLGGLVVPSP